jgi:hypothetical protein
MNCLLRSHGSKYSPMAYMKTRLGYLNDQTYPYQLNDYQLLRIDSAGICNIRLYINL